MSKSYKGSILLYMVFVAVVATLLFSYVALKLSIDEMKKEKLELGKTIQAEKNESVKLTADYQYLSAERRISTIAASELNMRYYSSAAVELVVDEKEIEKINADLKATYEQ